jgi:hypothetical protein
MEKVMTRYEFKVRGGHPTLLLNGLMNAKNGEHGVLCTSVHVHRTLGGGDVVSAYFEAPSVFGVVGRIAEVIGWPSDLFSLFLLPRVLRCELRDLDRHPVSERLERHAKAAQPPIRFGGVKLARRGH